MMYPRKILYIEDDQIDIKKMIKEIDKNKFEILVEINGDEAIKKIQMDKHKLIKAILLDIKLIDRETKLFQRLQGDDIAREIKKIRPEMPIIAISRRGKINSSINGYYPKEVLFKLKSVFKDLEEALWDAIQKVEISEFYPEDGGAKQWQDRWGPEYIEFRNKPDFSSREAKVGNASRQDYDLLNDGKIRGTYRKYRGTDSLTNILIARRVIFAAAFASCIEEGGIIKDIAWNDVCDFLGLKIDDWEGLKNLMYACGIKWGGIINRATLLKEEENWLKENSFLTFL